MSKYNILITVLMVGIPSWSWAGADYQEAQHLFEQKNYQSAVTAYDELTRQNPVNGDFWIRLAACHYYLKDYNGSIDAYKKAIDLGHLRAVACFNVACNYGLMGEVNKAVAWVERAIQAGMSDMDSRLANDSDFDKVRNDPVWRKRFNPAVENLDRVAGWRTDLEYLGRRFEESHINPFKHLSREAWYGELSRISLQVPNLKDHEIFVRIMELVARIGDGHSVVWPVMSENRMPHSLPVKFFDFEDGLFVTMAHKDYAEIVGGRVLKIGQMPLEQAYPRIKNLVSRDNAMGPRWIGPIMMTKTEILAGTGIVDDPTEVSLTVQTDTGQKTVILKSIDSNMHLIRGKSLPSGWVDASHKSTNPLPLWRQEADNPFRYVYLKEHKLVYFAYTSVRDKPDKTLEAHNRELFQFINNNEVETLILDIRNNNGGNSFLNQSLIHGLIRCQKLHHRRGLVTIIGRNTFSAAMNLVNDLEEHTQTLFVGEPTGSSPVFTGETNPLHLPYSGMRVSASNRHWQARLSNDARTWVAPTLYTPMTSTHYRNNIDPAMDAIMSWLNRPERGEGR